MAHLMLSHTPEQAAVRHDYRLQLIPPSLSLFLPLLQELKESFNYGLFAPPANGKAGKFLDEERRLGDYPFNGPVGYLEVSISNSSCLQSCN